MRAKFITVTTTQEESQGEMVDFFTLSIPESNLFPDPWVVFKTRWKYRARYCYDALVRYGLTSRLAYNTSEHKAAMVYSGYNDPAYSKRTKIKWPDDHADVDEVKFNKKRRRRRK